MAYKSSESERKHATENTSSFADIVGLSHSPEAIRDGDTYRVDFFTYDLPGVSERISHWEIDIEGEKSQRASLSAHHVGFQVPYSNATSETTHSKGKDIILS